MEGSGSRQNRSSARFISAPLPNTNGPPPPPVFNGPVRKWKKQWVTCATKETFGSHHNRGPPLVLCRWAPVRDDTDEEEPRKRRIRYMPVTPTKKSNNETSKSDEAKESKNLQPSSDVITSGKTSFEDISEESQEELSNWFQPDLNETQNMFSSLFGDTTQNASGEGTKMQINWE